MQATAGANANVVDSSSHLTDSTTSVIDHPGMTYSKIADANFDSASSVIIMSSSQVI